MQLPHYKGQGHLLFELEYVLTGHNLVGLVRKRYEMKLLYMYVWISQRHVYIEASRKSDVSF
jgi:hypothetical protein